MSNFSERSFSYTASGSSSPLPSPVPTYRCGNTALAKRSKYLRRLFYFKHMDFEFALWQMLSLFVAPQKVYRNFQYRKQTKNQFARDDPAFLVLLSFWLIVSSLGFAVVLKLRFLSFLKFLLWVIFIDCIGVGILICTSLWLITNRYLRKPTCKEQDVEWGYAFDVHLNAFFPLLIILHIFQLFFYHKLDFSNLLSIEHLWISLPYNASYFSIIFTVLTFYFINRSIKWYSYRTVNEILNVFGFNSTVDSIILLISQDWFFSRLVGNSLWLIALGYYIYITFLGYSALPILENTQVLLYPLLVLALMYIIFLVCGYNICLHVMNFYEYRVL